MKKIYCISGLGADSRVFKYLTIENYELVSLKWENPQKNESIFDYSKRMAQQIDEESQIILLGISFGGLVALELSKILDVRKTIIISSFKGFNELPLIGKFIFKSRIYKIIPSFFLKLYSPLSGYFFSIKSKSGKLLLKTIIKDTDTSFLRWALEVLGHANSNLSADNLYHIHGTADRLVPIRNCNNAIPIKNGGHFMIVEDCVEVSTVVERCLIDTSNSSIIL